MGEPPTSKHTYQSLRLLASSSLGGLTIPQPDSLLISFQMFMKQQEKEPPTSFWNSFWNADTISMVAVNCDQSWIPKKYPAKQKQKTICLGPSKPIVPNVIPSSYSQFACIFLHIPTLIIYTARFFRQLIIPKTRLWTNSIALLAIPIMDCIDPFTID